MVSRLRKWDVWAGVGRGSGGGIRCHINGAGSPISSRLSIVPPEGVH